MDINSLAEQLRDPDPRVRVSVLRVLAMVEETRALPAIRWIYKHDPEPGVREVADWAGRLIYAAKKRGHSTQQALEEMFERPFSPENQRRFLASFEFEISGARNVKARQYAAEVTYNRKLAEAMHEEQAEQPDVADDLPALSAPGDDPDE
jgi:hypothetical protein